MTSALTNDRIKSVHWNSHANYRQRLNASIGYSFYFINLGVSENKWEGLHWSNTGFRHLDTGYVPKWAFHFKDSNLLSKGQKYDNTLELLYGRTGSMQKDIDMTFKLPFYELNSNSFFHTHNANIKLTYYRP